MIAIDHNRTMLQLYPKPDLSIGDKDGDDIMWYALRYGDPHMVGATVKKKYGTNLRPVHLVIPAKADFSSGAQDSGVNFYN